MRLGLSNGWWMEFTSINSGLPIHFYIGTYSRPHLSYRENFIGNEAGLIWWMKYAIKLGTSHHFSMTAYLIPHNSKTYNSYLGYIKYYIRKNSGLDNLDVSVPIFCPLYFCLRFVTFCLRAVIGDNKETEWRQNGDRKETRKCQWFLTKGSSEKLLLTTVFVQSMNISDSTCTKCWLPFRVCHAVDFLKRFSVLWLHACQSIINHHRNR